MLSINNVFFNDDKIEKLKDVLIEDIYSFDKLKLIFKMILNKNFDDLFNICNFNKLNYYLREGYVYKNIYSSIEECVFNYCYKLKIFTSEEIRNYLGLDNNSSLYFSILKNNEVSKNHRN